jgi:protoporphyrinogen oxidase
LDPSPLSVAVIGGGPAGLTSAYALAKEGVSPTVFERDRLVGGISRTEEYKGYRFDIGGHRFFTKVPEVEALWHEIMGDRLKWRSRLSRIFYDGKFYPYPIALWPTLRNLGPVESARILGSYAKAKVQPLPEENLEQWVTNRFGDRLYRTFFKTYTEKVWGIPCTEIRADWAAQRIKGVSVRKAIQKAVTGKSKETSLIDAFWYPDHGPGELWEACTEQIEEMGGEVRLQEEVLTVRHDGRRATHIEVRSADGQTRAFEAEHVINSMPLALLAERLDPPPPPEVLRAARALGYRDFLVVVLILDEPDLFPDNWIYVHAPEVEVGRVQNFKNWSPKMVPDPATTALGMEYFCDEGDRLWTMDDDALVRLAAGELEAIGLAPAARVFDGTVIRQKKAYPVYDADYQDHVATLRGYLARFENLQTVGRAGMHRYNNQDHSMLTAMLAARNVLGDLKPNGDRHDLWSVNVERSYHESFVVEDEKGPSGDGTDRAATPSLARR